MPIAGRPPEKNVRDVNGTPVQPDRRQHPVEQLAAWAHEGKALAVFFGTRRLANQHHAGLGIAIREDEALSKGSWIVGKTVDDAKAVDRGGGLLPRL